MLQARARPRSSSHSFCMVFSVNLSLSPILSLISLSLFAAVHVLVEPWKLENSSRLLHAAAGRIRRMQPAATAAASLAVAGLRLSTAVWLTRLAKARWVARAWKQGLTRARQ